MSEVGPEVTSLVKAGSVLVDQSGLLDQRIESVENAEALLLRVRTIHLKVAMIAFNLARYARTGPHGGGERTPTA